MSSRVQTILGVLLVVAGAAAATDGAAAAFVAEVTGQAQVQRPGVSDEAAKVGAQLFAGDTLRVQEGSAVVVYLSGRTIHLGAGAAHGVQSAAGAPSPLMDRLRGTLDEVAGAASESGKPAVQGMARDLAGVSGAVPANCRVTGTDFVFRWDPLAGATAYEVTVQADDGTVLVTRQTAEPRLAAGTLGLVPGHRYRWQVTEAGSFASRGSGSAWLAVADTAEAEAILLELGTIGAAADSASAPLLQAACLYQDGFLMEAVEVLSAVPSASLGAAGRALQHQAYARMGLAAPPASACPALPTPSQP
ncbi:MAG: hypothetical protein WDA75_22590 [Candidatus Latescibacterota bacterium]|jgi:hypothetical protein